MSVHLWEILVHRNTQNNIRKNIPKNEKETILVASFVPFRCQPYNNRKRYFSQSTRTFSVNSDGDPCSVRCARIDEGVREGNSGACLQHVWPLAKEVGKRGGNNRHDRKFVWVVVRIKSLAIRQPATAHTRTPPILLNHRHLPLRMTNESGRLNFSLLRCFFHRRVAPSLSYFYFFLRLFSPC